MHADHESPKRADTYAHGGSGGAGGLRESRVAQTFVSLADTLVDEFDLTEFLHVLVERCVELLDVSAAGVLLADQRGGVRMAAASSEKAELLEMFAADTHDGPCVECLNTGRPTGSNNLAADADRWPRFVAAAEMCGFGAAHALPMRLRRDVIGALSLLDTVDDGAHSMSAQLGQALADIATIGILQQRAITDAEVVVEQLQSALNTRVVIEQAKGMLAAHSHSLTPEQAFVKLRGYARARRLQLSNLAHEVIAGTASITAILAHPRR
ncbi:MAG TPA: GAF and ANTAR domain-containing protein [Actinophytocola sp.]|jgi:transcriptional regulator with GAF, ATPase, and Fis domain|nr:GAF and ANTAR domain-containing protein [Actinophytocola sp.]